MRLIPGANTNAGRGSSGMTLIERKKDDEQQSELDRIIEEDRKNQERLQNEETQRLADQQNKKNESAADKALNTVADYAVAGFGVASRAVKGGLDAYNAASDFIVKTAEEHPKIAEAVLGTTPVGNAYKLKKQVDSSVQDAFDRGVIDEKTKNWIDDPVLTALNTETGAKITGEGAKSTSNLPLKAIARVKAIGDDTYDEALSSLMEWRNNPESPRWQKLLADVQDSGAQLAVGVLLSVGASFITRSPKAGQAVGMTYYGAISAESQRQEKGSVTSKKNIAVDTIGDIALGGLVESSLKAIIKDSAKRTAGNVAAQTVKGTIVEGSTEVSQTMVKYANDYNDAKSDEEKLSVIDKTKNYVLNGGLLNEFLVGGISGGVITGFATMAGVAATGNDGVDPSLQPKKPGSDEEKKGSPSLSADVDIAKLRDQAITFKESAENNQDNPVALEQYAAVRDALSDYEIAFKERPVYIAQNEQESPLMQIETVAYPDGKFSYRFSADVGSTSLDSNFDNQDTVGSQEEAIKKASETIKSWVEEQLSNAADNEEAIKFQRIFDEADALLSGKAKFESALPSIKETAQTSEERLSKESGEATNQVNDNAPGLASFDSTDPINQRYIKTAVSSDTLESFQKNLDESTLISRIAPDVQMDDRTGVYRAIKAFYESYHTKKESAQPVDKSEKKEEKPVTKKDEKPESVEAKEEKAQPKEKSEVKNDTELEAPKKSVLPSKKKVSEEKTIVPSGENELGQIKKFAQSKDSFTSFVESMNNRYGWGAEQTAATNAFLKKLGYEDMYDTYTKLKGLTTDVDETDIRNIAQNIYRTEYSAESYGAGVVEPTEEEDKKMFSTLKKLGMSFQLNSEPGEGEGGDLNFKDPASVDIKLAQNVFSTVVDEYAKLNLDDYTLEKNDDGTINLYHGTNLSAAESIIADQFEEHAYFSPVSRKDAGGIAGAAGYGGVVLKSVVDPRYVTFNGLGEFYVDDIENGVKSVSVFGGQEVTPGEYEYEADIMPINVHSDKPIVGEDVVPAFSIKEKKPSVTTKILEDLSGRETVSKQYILDATNRGDIKQAERDLIREMLKGEGDTVNVKEFSERVRGELLPLESKSPWPRYENVTLPSDARGPVAGYKENVYESPIKTSAGSVHFYESRGTGAPNYFAHTRIEDLPTEGNYTDAATGRMLGPVPSEPTRRVIEIQSDLFQKGRLEEEKKLPGIKDYLMPGEAMPKSEEEIISYEKKLVSDGVSPMRAKATADTMREALKKFPPESFTKRELEISKLEPYRNTWHERIIREEIKRAADDGKSILLFPTGETAMKIEGLGDSTTFWNITDEAVLSLDNISIGKEIRFDNDMAMGEGGKWIITGVLGDGKFKAIPKKRVRNFTNREVQDFINGESDAVSEMDAQYILAAEESFDISGKVDTNNPIYRFYEKTVARYLKNRYNAKLITDELGVSWFEVLVDKELASKSVEAFSKKDRSTRGKDGKFTGSNAIDAITTDKIEKYISNGQAFETVRRIQKETNPALRAALQYRIAWDLLSNGGDDGFVTQGLFRVKKGMVETSLQLTPDEFENVLRHEINHAAFVMLPRDKQMEIEEWYIDISNDANREKEFIGLYDDQPGMVYDYMKRAMQASKKGLLVNWDGTEKSVITFMADETFNRYMNSRGDKPLRGVEKIYRDMVSAIVRLLERINQATFKNKRFSAKAKKRALDEMYKDVFNPNGGTFVPPAGYLDFLGKQGVIPGEIQFGNDGKNIDIDQAPARMVASAKEKETKTVRFSKIISRRRELRELKRKREAAFLATEEGQQVAAEAEINRENYEAPNENIVQGIKNSTYFQKEGSISDAMGEGYLMEKNGRYVVAEAGRRDVYVQRGYQAVMEIDSFASEAGFDSGTDYLRDQFDRRKLPDTAESAIRRILNDRDKVYGKVDEELKKLEIELSEAKDGKGAFYQGMRIGSTIARNKYNERLKVFRDRKAKVRAAKDFFGLSDSEFKKIGGARDIQTMGESEFQGFLNHIQVQAEKSILRSQAMELLVGQIQEKQLKRYDNLRRAMKLPAIDKMTTEQIKEFDAALEFSQEGDEFFTQRQLETVKNTELKGIKTVREARERLSARLNMPLTSLGSIQVAPSLDRLRFDAAIAEANPFYGMIVAETNTATLEAESRFMAIEEQANKLIKAARKSRSRGIIDRLTPKDSRIFSYLESTDKSGLALDMTKEELEAAEFIRRSYEGMRDYLVKNGMLEKYRENYITHVRKGFLETLRDDGIVEAFRDLIAQQQEDEATFNILSADTGNILPLEKFFQFSLKRTGGIKPTENVATAFLSYTRAFEKKRALDGLIPKLDIYTYSIEPKRATKTGLLMDRSLKRFLNDYLNNKKGRRFDFGGFLRQGGKADLALRSVRALTTILDLGLSLPGGIASNVGEQSTNFVQMGVKAYIKGSARYATFKGRRFLKKYRNFTGKNPWSELAEASKGVGDRFNSGLFILFRDAQVRANQQFLLGSITDEEYKTGEITPQRLGELNIAMGRWRVVDGAKSIIGSTSAGGVLTQYKTWAVPIFRTTLKDITTIVGNIKDKGLAKALYSREGAELFRSIMVLGTVALIVKSLVSSDKDTEKEKTFFEKLVDKSVRDLLSTIGVFDPTFFASEPRVLAFFGDLAAAIKSIGLLEEYADDASDGSYEAGDLKGAKKLKKTITPMLIKQFDASGNTPNKETSVEKYLKQGLSTEDAAAKAAEELNLDPESDDYESDLKAIEKEAVRQATVAALGDKTTARIEKARLNTTKMRILNDAKNEMTDQEFQAYIEKLYDGKIISKTIFQEFWNY